MNTAQVIWIATMINTALVIALGCAIAISRRLTVQVRDLKQKREIDELKRRELKQQIEAADLRSDELLARAETAETMSESPDNALKILRGVVAKVKEDR